MLEMKINAFMLFMLQNVDWKNTEKKYADLVYTFARREPVAS